MASFEVIIAPRALEQLESYIDYIQYTLLNPIAAQSVWKDALESERELLRVADSLRYCDNPRLRELGYRLFSFKRHRYVMLYRVEGKKVFVDAVYHQMQDYENIFSKWVEET